MAKCLVTGGAGFIGSNLTDVLIERGDKVIIIDNLSTGKKENLNSQARFYEKDLRNLEDIKPLFKGVDYVFHEAALARVDNRLAYGMIRDVSDLAAAYAEAIAQGHCFNDATKRTAHQAMDVCLDLNGVELGWEPEEIGQQIIALAQKLTGAGDLAEWLRARAG